MVLHSLLAASNPLEAGADGPGRITDKSDVPMTEADQIIRPVIGSG